MIGDLIVSLITGCLIGVLFVGVPMGIIYLIVKVIKMAWGGK